MADKNTIKSWFETNDMPSQAQFWAWLDSYRHNDEKIPITAIDDIEAILAEKADAEALTNHKNDKGQANGYTPLNEFVKVASEYLNIVDDFVTGGSGSLASAETVKTLKAQIDAINFLLSSDNVNIDNVQKIVDAIEGLQAFAGQNIANNDLSNLSARIFTQGNTFTWNTSGFLYYLKNLIDKTGNGSYSKVVVIEPVTGQMVTRDFADPTATTLAVQNATTTQKTAMRTALLGTAVPSPPTISGVSRMFFGKGIDEYTDMYGLNLTLLDPSFIYIELPNTTRIYAIGFYNLTATAVRVLWNIPVATPDGIYEIKIQNGVTVQGLSQGKLHIGTWNFATRTILSSEWIKRKKINNSTGLEYTGNETILNDNIIISETVNWDGSSVGTPTHTIKSPNFLGYLDNDVWEVVMTVNFLGNNGSGINSGYPFLGVTPTKDVDFLTLSSFVLGEIKWVGYGIGGQGYTLDGNAYSGNLQASGLYYNVVFSKPIGKIVYIKLIRSDSNIVAYTQSNIVATNNPLALYFGMYVSQYTQLKYQVVYNVKIKQ